MKYNGLADFIRKNLESNEADREELFFKAVNNFGYEGNFRNFTKYVTKIKSTIDSSRIKNKQENVNDLESEFIKKLKSNKIMSIDELSRDLSCKKSLVLDLIKEFRAKGFEIIYSNGNIALSKNEVVNTNNINKPLEDKEIIFGVASDLHFGSKACQITALNEFAEICKESGVKYIFSPGDIVAGYNIYNGQIFDVYSLSSEEQEESVIKNLPTGFEWIMLGGNHDYSFIRKGGGHNPLSVIENHREDVTYVGFDEATVPILNNVDLKMWHPSGGVPYSISYRIQKGIEQLAFDELRSVCMGNKEKPTLRFVLAGHLHIQLQAMFGSIFGMQCGTFEGTTNYLKRKGLVPNIGGWIVHAKLGSDGFLKDFNAKFHLFDEIEDDWKNYSHSLEKKERINRPLFET